MADGSPSPDTGEVRRWTIRRWWNDRLLVFHEEVAGGPADPSVEVMPVSEHEAVLQASLDREAALKAFVAAYDRECEEYGTPFNFALRSARAALASTSREPTEGSGHGNQ